jgi:hypothetical protein
MKMKMKEPLSEHALPTAACVRRKRRPPRGQGCTAAKKRKSLRKRLMSGHRLSRLYAVLKLLEALNYQFSQL